MPLYNSRSYLLAFLSKITIHSKFLRKSLKLDVNSKIILNKYFLVFPRLSSPFLESRGSGLGLILDRARVERQHSQLILTGETNILHKDNAQFSLSRGMRSYF